MMNGKQKFLTSESEGCLGTKKAKVDLGKENDPTTKIYPKRNRTPSSKAFESISLSSNISSTTSAPKNSTKANPGKRVLSPISITESPKKSLDSSRNVNVHVNVETPEEEQLIVKPVSGKSKKTVSEKAPKKSKSATPKTKNPSNDENKRKRCMPKTVEKRLEQMGINAGNVSNCVKAAMCKGFVKLTGDPSDLEQVIIEGEHDCHTFKVLLKDVLYQPDYGGDYEDGSENATATCSCCGDGDDDYPGRAYVTRLCTGQPDLDSGKFHNHCTQCPKGFGVCINDYRMAHCGKCNKHWFSGLSGFPCDNCKRIKQQSRGIAGLFMDSDDNSDSDDSYRSNGCTIS